jgi:hypothetical protein
MSKWAMELGALNIDFKPRTTIKSQELVDFMYFDGSLKLGGGGAGVLFISPTCEQLKCEQSQV